jgi:hypothetical protein
MHCLTQIIFLKYPSCHTIWLLLIPHLQRCRLPPPQTGFEPIIVPHFLTHLSDSKNLQCHIRWDKLSKTPILHADNESAQYRRQKTMRGGETLSKHRFLIIGPKPILEFVIIHQKTCSQRLWFSAKLNILLNLFLCVLLCNSLFAAYLSVIE